MVSDKTFTRSQEFLALPAVEQGMKLIDELFLHFHSYTPKEALAFLADIERVKSSVSEDELVILSEYFERQRVQWATRN